MNIPEHRKAIDRCDAQLIKLLNERTRHVLAIGEIKRQAGEEVFAPYREDAVLQRICRLNQGPVPGESLRAIYREIMSCARSLQKPLTIGYLGPEATFTHQAAIQQFGASLNYAPLATIADVFTEVGNGQADYGVVPVENSTEGAVTHTLDMFVESDLDIVAQLVLKVQHCLVANCRRSQIRKLFVHPQTLGQCRAWVQANLPHGIETIETSSNARSAELAAAAKNTAAIAGLLAAEKYRVAVLDQDIQDNVDNFTRFLVLGRGALQRTGNDRTSIMFSLIDRPGGLYDALAPLRKYRINMTKIESRPSKRRAWEYFFFVDCEGHQTDPQLAKAFRLLRKHCRQFKVLGSYPKTQWRPAFSKGLPWWAASA